MMAPGRPVAAPGIVSAAVAPVALIGGFTVAALAYPGGFDSSHGTISALAAVGSPVRALRPASRATLAVGGAATIAVAAFPLAVDGRSAAHAAAAAVAFLALSIWPALIRARTGALPPLLRPTVTRGVALVLTAMALAFFVLVAGDATSLPLGTLERVLAGAQALVPLVVVLALVTTPARTEAP